MQANIMGVLNEFSRPASAGENLIGKNFSLFLRQRSLYGQKKVCGVVILLGTVA